MRKQNIFYALFFLGFVFLVFRNWFLAPQIIGGDWPYLFDEMLKDYSFFFSLWNPFQGNGFGGMVPFYSLGVFHGFTVFLSQTFHITWSIAYKFSWFGLFIGLSIFSSMYLLKTVLPRAKFWQQIFASMVFSTNTYILMVVSGGQMGVALSYSLAPLVLARFIKLIDHSVASNKNFQFFPPIAGSRFGGTIFNFQLALLAGLVLAIQVMFDPRIAYISMIAVAIYMILNLKKNILNTFSPLEALARWGYLILNTFIIPGFVAVLLHAAWIIPLMVTRINPIDILGDAYAGTGIVKFLSFASFSQSFSLLHPNWPENIFGKVGFMKPEFLLLPILAFTSLAFVNKLKDKQEKLYVLFFVFLGITGAFLAKGANPPFGGIYLWLFTNIPGFVMFRDPTKFYLLAALSYSILIPYSLFKISSRVSSIKYQVLSRKIGIHDAYYIIPATFLALWIFLINPAVFGQLGGTFKKHDVPKEYVELKDFLYNQNKYFRTLWVPRQQRFSFASNIHPSIEAEPLFGTRSAEMIAKKISGEQEKSLLSELSVKYILIQYDSLGEQFLEDRKYREKQRMEYEKELDAIPWLKKIQSEKITVYETPFKKDHFSLDKAGKISAITINSMHYILTVSIDKPQYLIFSEGYSPYWVLKKSQETIPSRKTKNGLNSFWLDQKGKYKVEISFSLEKFYNYGRIISLVTFLTVIFFVLLYFLRKKY